MTTLLFLPSAGRGYSWANMRDGDVAARGEGLPPTAERVVAVAPAQDVTLHWAELPDRSAAQAVAAARLLVAEASAAPLAELHVAVGDEGTRDRPIAVVATATLRDWLAELAALGIDPAAVVPSALLLPRPDAGYVEGRIGDDAVVRGTSSAFAADPLLLPLLTNGEEPAVIAPEAVDAILVQAASTVPLDLRQGMFARRRRRAIDWPLVRRLAVLAATILLATLAIDVARIVRFDVDTGALDARADALGRTGLIRGETVTDVDRQLAERLSGVRGPGLGFSATTAAVYGAVRAVPGTELTGLDFSPNGDLRLSVAAARESLPTDLKRALEAAGFAVTAGVFQSANGRVTGEMTVRRP